MSRSRSDTADTPPSRSNTGTCPLVAGFRSGFDRCCEVTARVCLALAGQQVSGRKDTSDLSDNTRNAHTDVVCRYTLLSVDNRNHGRRLPPLLTIGYKNRQKFYCIKYIQLILHYDGVNIDRYRRYVGGGKALDRLFARTNWSSVGSDSGHSSRPQSTAFGSENSNARHCSNTSSTKPASFGLATGGTDAYESPSCPLLVREPVGPKQMTDREHNSETHTATQACGWMVNDL